jgi:hypothetical protein
MRKAEAAQKRPSTERPVAAAPASDDFGIGFFPSHAQLRSRFVQKTSFQSAGSCALDKEKGKRQRGRNAAVLPFYFFLLPSRRRRARRPSARRRQRRAIGARKKERAAELGEGGHSISPNG